MIDVEARTLAANLLERFRSGTATNDELADDWPTSEIDVAIDEIGQHLSGTYGDSAQYRLDPRSRSDSPDDLYWRVVQFLRSDLEYEWPRRPRISIPSVALAFATVGVSAGVRLWRFRGRFLKAGAVNAWPFKQMSDLNQRLQP